MSTRKQPAIVQLKVTDLTKDQVEKAVMLRCGKIIAVYRDGAAIRIELEKGNDPYVWHRNCWVAMQ